MDAIETLDPAAFESYLKKTQNTICGRRPILLLLCAIERHLEVVGGGGTLSFLDYSQSSQCVKRSDSSVSYGSASLTLVE